MSDEADLAEARVKAALVVNDPTAAPTSELLAMFVGLAVGGALGMPSIVDGTGIERDHALGVVGEELNRRIPAMTNRYHGDIKEQA